MEEVKNHDKVALLVDEIISVEEEKSCYLKEFESKFKDEKKSLDLKALTDKYRSNEIDDVLINTETSDDGGKTAMTGFYYQLLITTKYVLEMLEGKWDRVVVDHHQDIIVYNDEKIRFIQVKTKKTPNENCLVSQTNAYNEWIPKLFLNQKLFKNTSVKCEFELVSNCTFLNSKDTCKNFESFYLNKNFQNGETEGDLFNCLVNQREKEYFKEVKKEKKKYLKEVAKEKKKYLKEADKKSKELLEEIDKNANEHLEEIDKNANEYLEEIDKNDTEYLLKDSEIKSALKSFKVTKFSGNKIKDTLYLDIGKQFSEHIRANDEIVNMFVSFLFEKCYYPESVSIQIINNDNLKQLMTSIGLKIQSTVEQEIMANSTDEIIGNFIDKIKELFSKSPVYDELLKFIDELEQELGGFLKKNEIDSISTILSRYLKKQKYGGSFRFSKSEKMNEEAKKMFKAMALIKFYFGEKIEIDTTSDRLLILNSQENQFNLYGVEENLFWDINEVISDFKNTFYDLDLEEKLKIIKNPYFKIILSGTYDNEVELEKDFIEVSCKDKAKLDQLSTIKEFEGKDSDDSIAYVKNQLFFTDAEDSKFNKVLKKMKSYNQIQDIKDKLSEEFKI